LKRCDLVARQREGGEPSARHDLDRLLPRLKPQVTK
jgi:hypothetical protein